MSGARAILAPGVTRDALERVGRLLAAAAADPGFVPAAELSSLHGGDSAATILRSDPDGLTLMLARFSDREETPVHDHGSWGVACVVSGRDRYRHWRRTDDGSDPERAALGVEYERELGPGDFTFWSDPPADIHSQQGIGAPALELVLFGKNVAHIPRHYFDTGTGAVRTALPQ